MSACSSIEEKLKIELEPSHLEVIDESYLHNVEPGRESHVRIVAVSEKFQDLNLVKRHQLIYGNIQEELSRNNPRNFFTYFYFTRMERQKSKG